MATSVSRHLERMHQTLRLSRFTAALWLLGGMIGCLELSDSGGAGGASGGNGGVGGVSEATPINPEPKPADGQPVPVICSVGVVPDTFSALPWELTVDPAPIEGGGRFSASFDGVAVFPESFLDTGQVLLASMGGFREVSLIELRATVVPHAGATGPPAVLTADSIPHQCTLEVPPGTRPPCDPANDLPGPAGLRGNTDCQPESEANPCAQFVPLPTSGDCSPGGVCWNVGREDDPFCPAFDFCTPVKKSQCEDNGFCVTRALRIPLDSAVQEYVADASGDVVFGWHEPDRDGPWSEVSGMFSDPIGAVGVRFYVGTLPVAFECLLGGDRPGDVVFGRIPDDELISFEIPERACTNDTKVCPKAFTSTNGGDCRFSTASELLTLEDPQGSPAVCSGLPSVQSEESVLPIGEPSILESPSFVVRATVEAKNVDDNACLGSTTPVANIDFWDAEQMKVGNTVLVFNDPTEVAVSQVSPLLRSTVLWPDPLLSWSSGPDVCCERTFQTLWQATVKQCEGW